jgi:hypothetical protein
MPVPLIPMKMKFPWGSRGLPSITGMRLNLSGAIDLPGQGGAASGSHYMNRGWVLTPPGNNPGFLKKIPLDGSTIILYVDGKKLEQGAEYNIFRGDIAGLFPGYENSEGALAYFELDTTAFVNGIHSIQWVASDNAGYTDGIGSRYFCIRNTGNTRQANLSGINQQKLLDNNQFSTLCLPDIDSKIPQ